MPLMLTPAALLDLARTYVPLSAHGRRFFWEMGRNAWRAHRSSAYGDMRDAARRQAILQGFRACDRVFARAVSDALCRHAGRRPRDVYRRYVRFAWLNTEMRCRTLAAFALPCDAAAVERVALVSMLIREWNDMKDRAAMPPLLRVWLGQEERPGAGFELLAALVAARDREVPRDRFPQFHAAVAEVPRLYDQPAAPDGLRARLEWRSHLAALIALRAGVDDIPAAVAEALKPVHAWFYILDEYADLPRDRAAGRATFLGAVADPEAELLAALATAEASLRRSAPAPEALLDLMRSLTRMIRDARRDGVDIEQEFLHAGGKA
jgi:hypothetical protein